MNQSINSSVLGWSVPLDVKTNGIMRDTGIVGWVRRFRRFVCHKKSLVRVRSDELQSKIELIDQT
jgi:hypothetical protein